MFYRVLHMLDYMLVSSAFWNNIMMAGPLDENCNWPLCFQNVGSAKRADPALKFCGALSAHLGVKSSCSFLCSAVVYTSSD